MSTSKASLKKRAVEELKAYWLIVLYLVVLFGSFTVYRRLITAETDDPYLHYGVALVEALVIAKVLLIGRLLGFSRRYEDRALIVPVLYKSVFFGMLVVLFGVLERLIQGWFHKEDLVAVLANIASIGRNELAARLLILVVTFIPFFAFGELSRVIGMQRLTGMFFSSHPEHGVHASGDGRP
ncbi:MAG: hypothetical protein JSR18_00820 [Proteobacteria bacterium]|nr:hypothetical protein [Pseudomonadota bacterium]